jgi:uncharacterized sulfatase
VQSKFWQTKPPEELYDLEKDRDEVENLAASPAHRATLERMRKAQHDLAMEIRDVGLLPEGEIHSRAGSASPYEAGHDDRRYPLARILATAENASSLRAEAVPQLIKSLDDPDSAVRYWAVQGLLMRGAAGVEKSRAALEKAMKDTSPYVRITAAEALGRYGTGADLKPVLALLLDLAPADRNGAYVSLFALNALDALGPKASPAKSALASMKVVDNKAPERVQQYGESIHKKLLKDL